MATWNDLPNELRLNILHYVPGQRSSKLLGYSLVCQQWQRIFEPELYGEVTVYITNNNILSGRVNPCTLASIVTARRRPHLKKLRLIIDFDPLSFTTISDALRRQNQLQHVFVSVIDGFIDTLSTWKRRDALFDLEIHEERSCGHHLNHYGSSLVHNPRRSVDCVRSIGHWEYCGDRCHCCSYRGLLSYFTSNMTDSLKEIVYEFEERDRDNKAMVSESWDFIPPSVKALTIRNMDDNPRFNVQSPPIQISVPVISTQLESLHVSCHLDAMYIYRNPFLRYSPASPPRWPNLRNLSMSFEVLGSSDVILNSEMRILSIAALGMPKIAKIELWHESRKWIKEGGYFCYLINQKTAHAFWETNWRIPYQPSSEVIDAWKVVAMSYTGRPLEYEVGNIVSAEGPYTIAEVIVPTDVVRPFYTAKASEKAKLEVPYEQRLEYIAFPCRWMPEE